MELGATLLFDHPSVEEIVSFVLQELDVLERSGKEI